MFAGPSGTRKTNATATLNKEKLVPQNSTLENHHGISMKNPEEITGNTRDLFLKMLSKLAQFLDFAETGLANFNKNTKQTGLEIKNDELLTESKSAVLRNEKVAGFSMLPNGSDVRFLGQCGVAELHKLDENRADESFRNRAIETISRL